MLLVTGAWGPLKPSKDVHVQLHQKTALQSLYVLTMYTEPS